MDVYFWLSLHRRSTSMSRHPLAREIFQRIATRATVIGVRIIMLDVPDRRPVEDVFCTDALYQRLFESAGLRLLDLQSPLASGEEASRWVSETRTAAWTIYVLDPVALTM